ncbi:MAG TPA: GNAT family N-acetyltransferase [Salinimicrobium sp.]|nr:GNAT family N-acetyltransferase [Salinimicrobium sp.]
MDYEIKQKEDNNQGMFFIEDEDGMLAEVIYAIQDNGIMEINETETNPKIAGKGLGSKLIKRVVDYAREKDLVVDPICSFAAAQFQKHEEYQDIQVKD